MNNFKNQIKLTKQKRFNKLLKKFYRQKQKEILKRKRQSIKVIKEEFLI